MLERASLVSGQNGGGKMVRQQQSRRKKCHSLRSEHQKGTGGSSRDCARRSAPFGLPVHHIFHTQRQHHQQLQPDPPGSAQRGPTHGCRVGLGFPCVPQESFTYMVIIRMFLFHREACQVTAQRYEKTPQQIF